MKKNINIRNFTIIAHIDHPVKSLCSNGARIIFLS